MHSSNNKQTKPQEGLFTHADAEQAEGVNATQEATGSAVQKANDTEFSFTGPWKHERQVDRKHINGQNYFNYTLSISETPGASARYAFSRCEGLSVYGPSSQGEADIILDGNPPIRVSCFAGGCLFSSGALPSGRHVVIIKVATGKVELDRIEGDGLPGQANFIENKNGAFVNTTPGFVYVDDPTAQSGCLLTCMKAGEKVEVCFAGPYVRLYGVAGPQQSAALLSIDNAPPVRIEMGNPKRCITLLWEIGNLEPGYHTLRITTEGPFALDGLEVSSAVPLMTEMNARTDLELEQMRLHIHPGLDPYYWKPVTPAFRPPNNGVTLKGGVFEETFGRNVKYLMDSWKLPYWVDKKDENRVWVDLLPASNEGRILIGMGHTLRFKEIPEFREAITQILEAVERRQYMNGNGWIMPYSSENYHIISFSDWPHFMRDEQKNYDRSMFTKGMLAAGQAGFTEAYSMLRSFHNWFNNAKEYLPLMLLGDMGIQGSVAGPMIYHSPAGTAADIVTNTRYYDMDWWLEGLAKRHPEVVWRFTLNRPHNYLLTSVRALFLIYLATGEMRYLNACLGAWNIFKDYFLLPGGGITLCEHRECLPWSYKLNNFPESLFETCGSVFWIELNSHLLSVFPNEEKYAAEIEESLFNFVLASQGNDGRIRYFNHLNGTKYSPGRWNTCCEIQATQCIGQLPQYIFSIADDAVSVNLFASAHIVHQTRDGEAILHMSTDFPYSPDVCIKVSHTGTAPFELRVRIPFWLEEPVPVMADGQLVGMGAPGTYFSLACTRNDMEIVFTLPMKFRLIPYLGNHRLKGATRYAVLYGPLLMALCGPFTPDCYQAPDEPTISLNIQAEEFIGMLDRIKSLCFAVRDTAYVLRPYFEVPDGDTFTCFPGLAGNTADDAAEKPCCDQQGWCDSHCAEVYDAMSD